MNLSMLSKILPVSIVRDADFVSLGFVTHTKPQILTFLESDKYIARFTTNGNISAVITTKEISPSIPETCGLVLSSNPRKDFYTFHNYLALHTDFYGKAFPSIISPTASIHPSSFVADTSVIIDDNVVIEPNATVYERSVIGKGSIIRSGVRIGAEGFEFKRFGEEILHIEHAGGARLGANVEVQCNSNIDRSVFGGFTEVGDDTKIDTLVHIGHHSKVGQRCLIAALTVVAGSTVIGNDVWIGPGSTISSELHIEDRAIVTLGSVVTTNIAEGQHVTGNFAVDHEKFIKFIKSIR
jgi:UDP-3-O-[3-hydroxymyristoyl] glucosamine N-acyltransferase